MAGSFSDTGELDPGRATFVVCCGKKESGKSIMAGLLEMSWPHDMAVLDVAADDGPYPRPGEARRTRTHDVVDLTGTVDELPRRWPEHLRDGKRPMILRYVPDPGSTTELEDMDAVTGLAYNHSSREKPALLVVHEMGRAAPAGRTPPHMRRVVNHGRHHGLSGIWCGPRTLTVEPLVIAQADLVYTFELNQPSDRKRVADNIGWDPTSFDHAVHELGLHEYLLFDGRIPKPEQDGDDDERLVHLDALPPDVVKRVQQWVAAEVPSRRELPGRR